MSKQKKIFIVRTNCEYSIEIEADNEDEAMKLAEEREFSEWGQAWASYEAEESD